MRTAIGNIALAAVVAGAMPGCAGPESTEGLACNFLLGSWGDGMPDLEMQVGDTARVPLNDHFSPARCLGASTAAPPDRLVAGSSDPAAVAVSVSESYGHHTLTTVALDVADSVRVTVRANPNHHADDEPHEFLVSVGDSAGR